MRLQNSQWLTKSKYIILMLILLLLIGNTHLSAESHNLVKNGSFEDGFGEVVAVGDGWHTFQSGNVKAGFYDDTWPQVVFDGGHAQLIELVDVTTQDGYGGIYQTVAVEKGKTYTFDFKGLIRSDEGSAAASGHGYILEYAVDLSGNDDWQGVSNWLILDAEDQRRDGPTENTYTFSSGGTSFKTTGNSVTLFIRAHKKWPDNRRGYFDVDAVRLMHATANMASNTMMDNSKNTSMTDSKDNTMDSSMDGSMDNTVNMGGGGTQATPTTAATTASGGGTTGTATPQPLPTVSGLPVTGQDQADASSINLLMMFAITMLTLITVGGITIKQRRRINY